MTDDPIILSDRYELGDIIGRGGMAEVRRAHDRRLKRDVAIKLLRTDLAGDPLFQARFRREAHSAAGLNHPTIVSVYDTGVRHDPVSGSEIPYIVMELVEGSTLRDILRDGRKILPERALELTAGVLDALSYSHKSGIIHRDIKPANVMLTKTGQVKVMDFGIARAVADTSATMTQTAAVIGTAQYLSPEQARGETVDARSDIYSAGCLLYELLTHRPPFQGDSPVSVAYQHVRETPIAPSKIADDSSITPAMDAIVLTSLTKDPADRYQNAQAMKDDIQRVLSGHEVTASIPTVFTSEATQVLPPVSPAAATNTAVIPAAKVESTTVATTTQIPPAIPPKKSTNPFVAALVTFLSLILLGGLVWGGWALMKSRQAPVAEQVAVPMVLNLTEAQAKTFLDQAGLTVVVKTVTGPADTKGLVLIQDPTSRTNVAKGSPVTITINSGPETVTIPSGMVGNTAESATKTLTDLGFKVQQQPATTEPATAVANSVVSLSPGEGSPVVKGSTIILSVATGKATVPNVRGMTWEEAQAELAKAGFVDIHKVENPGSLPNEIVTDQSPGYGVSVSKTTTITITVGNKATPSATASSTPTPSAATSAAPVTPTPTKS
ncbi:MAG: Stk1 family PASTA domain-containing Ser/Thr kinase [Propionibacteriaceae bacterium]